ncbi:epididymal-specific lipocalin-8 isoform X1 [Marmota marmota marmota]|uniref:epididymal-specific lipocalin-8 isoform X1 n=1 Tax=Marmota marmota marmota TaxID=9994 RepID=UPI0020926796|nr:epididymal-specific lipocalin-8 isoform X1 [Marmota marmota marmota]
MLPSSSGSCTTEKVVGSGRDAAVGKFAFPGKCPALPGGRSFLPTPSNSWPCCSVGLFPGSLGAGPPSPQAPWVTLQGLLPPPRASREGPRLVRNRMKLGPAGLASQVTPSGCPTLLSPAGHREIHVLDTDYEHYAILRVSLQWQGKEFHVFKYLTRSLDREDEPGFWRFRELTADTGLYLVSRHRRCAKLLKEVSPHPSVCTEDPSPGSAEP